jgi:DNA-binding SARP family transcriptional activator/TolB-like protein
MPRDTPFRLLTFGRLALLGPDGGEDASLNRRRLKLAVLVVLAMRRRPVSRDSLVDLFWGDQDEERARHSLSDALSHLRRLLGPDAISTRQAEVTLAEQAPLVVDALDFAQAVREGDLATAIDLYHGPFLDAVYVGGSAEFEQWVARERMRLDALFLQASDRHCTALARARRWDECAVIAANWLANAPMSADAALYRLNAVKSPGTHEADRRALDEYEALVERLARDYEVAPDKRVTALAADLTQRLAAAAPARVASSSPADVAQRPLPAAAPPPPKANEPVNATPETKRRPSRSFRRAAWVAAITVVVLGAGVALTLAASRRSHGADRRGVRPTIAVAGIHLARSDTSADWMAEGLSQMVASRLARAAEVDVVAPELVREVKVRAQSADGRVLSLDQLRDIGRRVGATWVASGALTRGDSLLVYDLNVHDVATGRPVGIAVVTAPDILSLGDAVASYVLRFVGGAVSSSARGDAETQNIAAYEHYVRALQASEEGRISEHARELDAAVALDSGFIAALEARMLLATANNESQLFHRMDSTFVRYIARATERDRMAREATRAYYNGEHERSEQMGREILARWPRDPRGYAFLSSVYAAHGRLAQAEHLFADLAALDSLGHEAGHGPCVSCWVYNSLSGMRTEQRDFAGAERSARRWLALQPDAPAAWYNLGLTLSAAGRFDAALDAMRRARVFAGGETFYAVALGRLLIMARRYESADSLITSLIGAPGGGVGAAGNEDAWDLRALLQRERGEFRASNRTIGRAAERLSNANWMNLMRANSLGRLGELAAARTVYERATHADNAPVVVPLQGQAARVFAWHHALEADALGSSGDTLYLRSLADSIELLSARSYYGRDWGLHHHVRGLIAARGQRFEEAVREFGLARWGLAGWTRTLAEMAKAQMALGRPAAALATLRDAYATPLDAMARYEPRSGLDFLMALAFDQSGARDSAQVYARYVRRAWQDSDPEVRMQLVALDHIGIAQAAAKRP